MELIVIFIFLIFSITLLVLAKVFGNFVLFVLGGLMLCIVGFSIMTDGYGTNETMASSSVLNYTYNNSIASNDLTSISSSTTKVYIVKYDLVSQAFGMFTFVIGLMFAFDGALEAFNFRKNKAG
jgi:hypothetical protein